MTEPVPPPEVLIVAGSRWFTNEAWFNVYMDAYVKEHGMPRKIISGKEPKGTDAMAERWALKRSVPFEGFPADWKKHGKAAGPIRNQEMAERGTHLLAFPARSGKGTQDMIRRAQKAGMPVTEIEIDWINEQ